MITVKSAPVAKRIRGTRVILYLAAQMLKDLNANFAQAMLPWDIAPYYALGKLQVADNLQTLGAVVAAAADAELVMPEEVEDVRNSEIWTVLSDNVNSDHNWQLLRPPHIFRHKTLQFLPEVHTYCHHLSSSPSYFYFLWWTLSPYGIFQRRKIPSLYLYSLPPFSCLTYIILESFDALPEP